MSIAIPPLPNTPSWRGAKLSTGTTLPLLYILPFTFTVRIAVSSIQSLTIVWLSTHLLIPVSALYNLM
jgi:hypothetical protein